MTVSIPPQYDLSWNTQCQVWSIMEKQETFWTLWSLVVVIQLLSRVWLFMTPWTATCQASLSFTISWSLLKLMSTESMMPSNHLILCCPLILLVLIFFSLWVFLELAFCIRWPKYWSFSFNVSHFNEHSGLIFFKTDFFDILLSKGLTGVFSSTTVQKHQFFGAQPCLWSNSHICTWPLDRYTLVIHTVFFLPYIPSKSYVYFVQGEAYCISPVWLSVQTQGHCLLLERAHCTSIQASGKQLYHLPQGFGIKMKSRSSFERYLGSDTNTAALSQHLFCIIFFARFCSGNLPLACFRVSWFQIPCQ